MSATAQLRRRAGQRISAALWGVLVAGVGMLTIAAYSGYEIDLELAAIIVLGAVGGWLLLSAAVSGIGRQKEIAQATAAVVEEPLEASEEASDEAADEAADEAREETAEPDRDQ